MIVIDRENDIWTVTLDRPDKANALSRAMLGAIHDAAAEAEAAGARAFVLTGRGKVFSAGADLDEARAGLATDPIWEALSARIAALPCLTIAALNGTAAGGSLGMVLACDLRLAAPGASFFYPVMRLGFLPQPSDPQRMAALVGPARSKMIFMAGQKIGADEALSWGLVDRLVAPEALPETVAALTEAVRAAPAGHAARIKAMVPPQA